MNKYLWEILVPHHNNKGKSFPIEHHRLWDAEVRKLAGGLTIFRVSKGQWINEEDKVYFDLMIPVRIFCTEEDIDKIIEFTIEHYDQEAVFCIRVSDYVKLVKRK